MKKDAQNAPANKADIITLTTKIGSLEEDIELMGGNLTFQIDEIQQENKKESENVNKRFDKLEKDSSEMKKSIDLNTEALSMLTKELREIKHIEFQVYNHENRIKKLEATNR